MEIKNFFQKIFSGAREPEIPKVIQQKFTDQFNQSINVEWQKVGEQFEAVFYRDELEHIASYQVDGSIVCLKVNLPLHSLPEIIAQGAGQEGEIMNAIRIESKEETKYELIVRDNELIRYFLLIGEKGELIKKEKL